jgi:hypothetical protein
VSRIVTNNDNGTTTTTIYDDVSGAVDAAYTVGPQGGLYLWPPLVHAVDYDLRDEYPWARYEFRYELYNIGAQLALVATVMDDGSAYARQLSYFGAIGNHPIQFREVTTITAANGRPDYVLDVYRVIDFRAGPAPDYMSKALDYDPSIGRLDYSITVYRNGLQETVDYDPASGNKDYAIITSRTGVVTAEDYDAATGLLDYVVTTYAPGHVLAQDYDAAGRLDYAVEWFADGRYTATDHDLADEHPWSTFTVAYGASSDVLGYSST